MPPKNPEYSYYLDKIKKDKKYLGLSLCPQYLQEDPKFVVKALNYGIHYDFIPDIIRDNEEIIKKAFSLNIQNMKYFSEAILHDLKWAKYFVSENGLALEYLKAFQHDSEIYEMARKQNNLSLVFAKNENNLDANYYLEALAKDSRLYFKLPEDIKTHEQILSNVLFKDPSIYFNLPKSLQNQENVVLDTLKYLKDKTLLKKLLTNLDNKFFNHFNIMSLAIEKSDDAFLLASEELKQNDKFILKSLLHNPMNLEYAPLKFKQDKKIVLECMNQYVVSFKFADVSLQNDPEVATKAVLTMPTMISYVSQELKKDYSFMEPLLEKRPNLYKHLPQEMKDNKEIFEKYFNLDPNIFADACSTIRNNPIYAYDAIKFNPNLIDSLGLGLKKDMEGKVKKELVLTVLEKLKLECMINSPNVSRTKLKI